MLNQKELVTRRPSPSHAHAHATGAARSVEVIKQGTMPGPQPAPQQLQPQPQPQPPPPSLAHLPEAVAAHLPEFLRQWDAGNLLQLSRGVRQLAAPCLRELTISPRALDKATRDPGALARLLGRLGGLRSLKVVHSWLTAPEHEAVAAALAPEGGAAGRALEELELAGPRHHVDARRRSCAARCPA